MLLVETSDDKDPNQYTLGERNEKNSYKCVLFLLENAFYDSIDG